MSTQQSDEQRIEALTSDLFMDKVENDFRIVAGNMSLDVRLVDCRENPDSAGPDCVRTPFSLMFRADVDEAHPMQQMLSFDCAVAGLETGPVEGVHIARTLRPRNMPPGAYFQLIFN